MAQTIGEKIAFLRKERHITQTELADNKGMLQECEREFAEAPGIVLCRFILRRCSFWDDMRIFWKSVKQTLKPRC